MEFQEMTLNNLDDLTRLYTETFNNPPWNENWTVATSRKRLHQMICCESFYGLLAYEAEELVGLILGCEEQFWNGATFQIREFCMRNASRGKGFGSILLEELERRLLIRGICRITLWTSRGPQTEGFYEKHEYVSMHEMLMLTKTLTHRNESFMD